MISETCLAGAVRDLKTDNNLLRKQGFVPCVLYGKKISPNIYLQVEHKLLLQVVRSANQKLLNFCCSLNFDNKNFPVKVVGVQRNPITDAITHVDFCLLNA